MNVTETPPVTNGTDSPPVTNGTDGEEDTYYITDIMTPDDATKLHLHDKDPKYVQRGTKRLVCGWENFLPALA